MTSLERHDGRYVLNWPLISRKLKTRLFSLAGLPVGIQQHPREVDRGKLTLEAAHTSYISLQKRTLVLGA
jgi:hypothetical protein